MAWPARARCNCQMPKKLFDFLDKPSGQTKCSDGQSALPSLTAWNPFDHDNSESINAAMPYRTQRTRLRAGHFWPPRPEPARRAYGARTENGGANRDRTDDPLLAKQVLSQLSYSPVCFAHGDFYRSRPHRPSAMAWPARARCNCQMPKKLFDFLDKPSGQTKCSDGQSALPSLTAWNPFDHDNSESINAAMPYRTQRTRLRAGHFWPPRPEPARRAYGARTENGGANRDRTDDPLLAKQVLSQLS